MDTLIEMMAKKPKPGTSAEDGLTVLPILKKDHGGACGPECGCGAGDDGCCGG